MITLRTKALGADPSAARRLGAAAVLVGLLAAGCGGGEGRVPVYPVGGTVKVGGEAPEGALVVLYPARDAKNQEIRPSAKVSKDGSFKLTTYDADDGAPAGDYVATIQWNKLVKRGSDFVAGPDVIPADYASPEKSPWKVSVRNGSGSLPALEIIRK